jgi:hypothetical protein
LLFLLVVVYSSHEGADDDGHHDGKTLDPG